VTAILDRRSARPSNCEWINNLQIGEEEEKKVKLIKKIILSIRIEPNGKIRNILEPFPAIIHDYIYQFSG
jgi:hypothetical protein